jgi:hypothetical protein
MPDSMRLTGNLAISASSVSLQTPIPLDFFLTPQLTFAYEVSLPTGITDQPLSAIVSAGGITTVQALIIMPKGPISLKLGTVGSNQAFTLGGSNSGLILLGTSLTAVSVSNSSGQTVFVGIIIAGTNP